jgi:hypothetical protein
MLPRRRFRFAVRMDDQQVEETIEKIVKILEKSNEPIEVGTIVDSLGIERIQIPYGNDLPYYLNFHKNQKYYLGLKNVNEK